MVEALAIRHAIIFALNRGIGSIVIHSDSKSLIKIIRNNSFVLKIYGVLHYAIFSLSRAFNFVEFKADPVAANDKADPVAKHAFVCTEPSLILNQIAVCKKKKRILHAESF